MGPWRFLLPFLAGGCLANFVAVLAIGAPDRLIIGASGAVSAVIGAYLALFPNARLGVVLPLGLFLEFVRAPASLLIGIWALLQVVFAYIRSEEHTSELQSLMRISYAAFCLKKKKATYS